LRLPPHRLRLCLRLQSLLCPLPLPQNLLSRQHHRFDRLQRDSRARDQLHKGLWYRDLQLRREHRERSRRRCVQQRLRRARLLRVRRCPHGPCRRGIVAPSRERHRAVDSAPVEDRVPDNRCDRCSPEDREDNIRRVQADPEDQVERQQTGRLNSGAERCRRERVRGRARRGVRECFHLCRTKCRRRRNPVSRFIRGSRLSGSDPLLISGRWKASGNCTRRGSVPVPETGERRRLLRHRNLAHRAM